MVQEGEYARLIDTANAPIFGVDVDGRVNVWNQCASNLTGFASEDVMGKHLVNEFITIDYRVSVQEVFDKALEGIETANFQFPVITKAGARVEVLLNTTTRRDEQGVKIGVVGIGLDITARIEQEQEYVRLIHTANAPIFDVNVTGKHLVNEFITPEYKASVPSHHLPPMDAQMHGPVTFGHGADW